jgi:uncharacterized membrane-anchored protein YitT (DUF2179 family)
MSYFWITVGAFLAAFAIRIFLLPSGLIDGGAVGIALILARIFGDQYLPYFLVLLNLPFIFLAYKHIRRTFVVHMFVAVILFAGFLLLLQKVPPFEADLIEVIVVGGALLGVGAGLVIRNGGCVDGTEILAIIINRKRIHSWSSDHVYQRVCFWRIRICYPQLAHRSSVDDHLCSGI